MQNMTVFILGIALLSAGTYLMRLGGAKLGSRLASMKGNILPGWRGCWVWPLRCFWPGARCR